MRSREGREVPALDAPIREAIGQPMCAQCVHCLDLCKGIYKRRDLRGDIGSRYAMRVIIECAGFTQAT